MVEASLGGETKNIDFEHKFEIYVIPLSRDIKQAVGYRRVELRGDWDSRCESRAPSSHRMYLKSGC